jgi:hypothetical protein
MLGQKLAGLNHVSPQRISRIAFCHQRIGRTFRVAANLSALSEAIGCDARALEPLDPGYLLGMADTTRLDIFQSSVLRFCPACLRVGFHSEIFQLHGVTSCPNMDVACKTRVRAVSGG